MALMPSLNPRIVEALYTEALCLADNVRARFERQRVDTTGARCDDVQSRAIQLRRMQSSARTVDGGGSLFDLFGTRALRQLAQPGGRRPPTTSGPGSRPG